MSEITNTTDREILADCCGGIILPGEKYTHSNTFNFHINRCHENKIFYVQNTLIQQALNLCYAVEELPASERQTKISIMASELSRDIMVHLEGRHNIENQDTVEHLERELAETKKQALSFQNAMEQAINLAQQLMITLKEKTK